MTESLFEDYGPYARLRPQPPMVDVPAHFSIENAPPGDWPTVFGSPGKTSRSVEPLVSDRYRVAWELSLGDATRPQSLLIGGGWLVVNGEATRAVVGRDGNGAGRIRRVGGPGFLDGERKTLLAEDYEGGLSTFVLPDGTRDAFVMLSHPQPGFSRELLAGPNGVMVLLSAKRSSVGERPQAVVEAFRVNDWRAKSELNIFQGLTPLAGLVRVKDGAVVFAAATTGPVLATPDGVRWCDWSLRTLAERAWETTPQAVSVGDDARVRFTCTDSISSRLLLVSPGEMPIREIDLPWPPDANWTPPLVAPDGGAILTPRGHAWSLDAEGALRWSVQRDERDPAGTLSSNGLLLLAGEELRAFTADGDCHVLWQPPERLITPPILAGGRIYVASAGTLFALEPAA